MVKQKEFRIVLPMTVAEYHIAQLYMVAKASEQETGKGEGVEIIKNEPFDDGKTKGQYTEKIIHLASKIPGWVKGLIPSLKKLAMLEQAWNSYPYCKTQYTCDFFGDRLKIELYSLHKDDNGCTENIHGLPDKEWKKVEVDFIDIANDQISPANYKEEEDPTKFKSESTGRGPLVGKNWKDSREISPLMCCYKLAKVEFGYWGIQGKAEKFIHKTALRDVFLAGHRQAFCWTDEWYGLTIDDIRQLEQDIKVRLAHKMLNSGRVSIGSKDERDALDQPQPDDLDEDKVEATS